MPARDLRTATPLGSLIVRRGLSLPRVRRPVAFTTSAACLSCTAAGVLHSLTGGGSFGPGLQLRNSRTEFLVLFVLLDHLQRQFLDLGQ